MKKNPKFVRMIISDRIQVNLKGKTFVCNRYFKPDIICVIFCESALAVQHERKHDAAVIRRHRRNARCRTVLAFMLIPMSQIPADLLTRGNMNESLPFGYLRLQVMHESDLISVIAMFKKHDESCIE